MGVIFFFIIGLALAYLVPPTAAIAGPDPTTRAIGLVGYLAAVANRALVAGRTGSRIWPDSLAHPLSMLALAGLTADSLIMHALGRTEWKGRAVSARTA